MAVLLHICWCLRRLFRVKISFWAESFYLILQEQFSLEKKVFDYYVKILFSAKSIYSNFWSLLNLRLKKLDAKKVSIESFSYFGNFMG